MTSEDWRKDANELRANFEHLRSDAHWLVDEAVAPRFRNERILGFTGALYGLLMFAFAQLDSWSLRALPEHKQSLRMVRFLDRFVHADRREENRLAVQLWRHQLVHQGRPEVLTDKDSGIQYRWLLHWGRPYLHDDLHYHIVRTDSRTRKLDFGLLQFIDDMERGLETFLGLVETDDAARDRYEQGISMERKKRTVTISRR